MLSAAVVVEAPTSRPSSAQDKLPPLLEDSSPNFSAVVAEKPSDKRARGEKDDEEEKMGRKSSDGQQQQSSSRFGGWLGGGSNKKIKTATAEELHTVQRSLMTYVAQAKTDMGARLMRTTEDLRQDFNDQFRKLRAERQLVMQAYKEEVTESTAASVQEIRTEIADVEKKLETRIQETVSTLESDISEVRNMVLDQVKHNFADSINDLRNKLDNDLETRFSELLALLQQQQHSQDSALRSLQQTVEEYHHAHQQELAESKAANQVQLDQSLEETRKLDKEVQEVLEARVKPLEDTINVLSSKEDRGVPSRAEMDGRLAVLEQNSETKLACLDEQTRSLRVAVAEVENIPTRRVEWRLAQASEALQVADESMEDISFFSPEFEAGGAHGLQLELRLPHKNGKDATLHEGDCELLLWGAECSLSLVFRLYLGTAHVNLHHRFDGLQPCSTGALCSWRDHINHEDDTLHLGVEILEAIREVTLPSRLASCSEVSTDSQDRLDSFPWRQPEGALVSHRHLIHRTLDLVQDQVDLMKSRMVHRVEWRIERASDLRRCFPTGECICSTSFDAGGIEGLQLIFFPSGHSDAREGHCSLYVYCPPGSFVHCWLMLGKQRWEASKAFDTSKGYYGRTSFCRFDACVDEKDNSVLVTMELQEARHDAALTPQSHAVAQKLSGGASSVESVVTLRRSPPQNTMEDVKLLPSIWTSKPKGAKRIEQGEAPDAQDLEDFRTFDDMPVVRKPVPPAPRRIASGGRCRPVTANNGRCRPAALETTPGVSPISTAASERYQMYTAC